MELKYNYMQIGGLSDIKINNRVIIQWFTANLNNVNQNVSFPTSFNSTKYIIQVMDINTGEAPSGDVVLNRHSFCECYDYRTVALTRVGATDVRLSVGIFTIGY